MAATQLDLSILIKFEKLVLEMSYDLFMPTEKAQFFWIHSVYDARKRKGEPKPGLKTNGKRMRRKLVEMNKGLKRLRYASQFWELCKHLCRILKGHYNYFGFAVNFLTLKKVQGCYKNVMV